MSNPPTPHPTGFWLLCPTADHLYREEVQLHFLKRAELGTDGSHQSGSASSLTSTAPALPQAQSHGNAFNYSFL